MRMKSLPVGRRWADPEVGGGGRIVEVVPHERVIGGRSVAITDHAESLMRARGVTVDEVLAVLDEPDVTGLRADRGRSRFRKWINGRRVDVVFEADPTQVVVVTVIANW